MAHEIHIDNGRASMMYSGEVPWHKLGQKVEGLATAAEAIKKANLAWKVTKIPVHMKNAGHDMQIRDKYAVVREDKLNTDDLPVLGIVGGSYTPLQNEEAFSFFDTIVRDKNAAIYETAGALGNGERVWMLAKLPTNIIVGKEDITKKYLLLSNNHDGKAGVQIKFTPIRVVCNNTLTAALAQGSTLSVPHHRDLHHRLKQVERTLGIINIQYGHIEDSFKEMANVRMNQYRLGQYLEAIFPDPSDPDADAKLKKAAENRSLSEHLFVEGAGNKAPGIAGTLWAAYNGVTELVDHRLSTRNRKIITKDTARLNSIWFGEGSRVKARAFKIAMENVKAWKN